MSRIRFPRARFAAGAPIAQLAEAADLKSAQCRFESDWGHHGRYECLAALCDGATTFVRLSRRALVVPRREFVTQFGHIEPKGSPQFGKRLAPRHPPSKTHRPRPR
jgi:hypothetical protein